MKKLKIYLDTSIISYLDQQDAPEKMTETLKFWGKIQAGEFEVFTSSVAIEELGRCYDEKLFRLKNYLSNINFTLLEKSDEVNELAKLYVSANVLTQKSFDDCLHIAYACVYNCDMVVSWNFKHIVNYKTISGVKSVNATAGYKEMLIYTPTMLIEKEETDDTL